MTVDWVVLAAAVVVIAALVLPIFRDGILTATTSINNDLLAATTFR